MAPPSDAMALARLLYDIVNVDRHRSSKEILSELMIKLEIVFDTERNEKLLNCIKKYKNSGESLTKIADEMYDIIYPTMKLNFSPTDFREFKFPEPILNYANYGGWDSLKKPENLTGQIFRHRIGILGF